jgi:RHS repeat-associated protein
MVSGAEDWRYIYTADDERFWMYRVGGGGSIWTLRGLDAKVLREYQAHAGWSAFKDYIYRGSALLAEADSVALGSAVRHFHLDHLGTVRAITNAAGQRIAYHIYYPYGQELTAFNQDTERMKFTGHERDLASLAGAGDDLDYMHARHYSLVVGRFLSIDPLPGGKNNPQTWNRYMYALSNPVIYIDPDGQEERTGSMAGTIFNLSGSTIWVAADVGGHTYVIPLDYGEQSGWYFGDADAIIVEKDNPIEGESEGAYKIGGADVDVENDSGSLKISRDGEYLVYYSLGRAGFVSQEEAVRQGWVIPQTDAGKNQALQNKATLYQKMMLKDNQGKEKEKKGKKEGLPGSNKKRKTRDKK